MYTWTIVLSRHKQYNVCVVLGYIRTLIAHLLLPI